MSRNMGKAMQKLEVLIEENAFGSVRPVEVVADVPVSALVPALVEELKLPQTDLFGKKLVYMLRHSAGGRILPENSTLLASGVEQGARLALDSYVLDGTVATLIHNAPVTAAPDPALHSSTTLADADSFSPLQVKNTSTALPHLPRRKRKWPRRAFLALGVVVVGVGGSGLGYAAYRGYTGGGLFNNPKPNTAPQVAPPKPAQNQPTTPPKALVPTMAQAVFTFNKHQKTVRSVTWSTDGTLLASGGDDAHAFVWSPNGVVQQDIPHAGSVQSLAWSPDRQRLVTGAQNQVTFYMLQNAAPLATDMHAKAVTGVSWATHGPMQVVSASQDNHAIVWNTTNYQQQAAFQRHTTPVLAVAWSADGQTVASGTQGGALRVWNGNNAQELHAGYNINTAVRALAFSSVDMRLAAGGNDGTVRIWNDGLVCQLQNNNLCADVPLMLQVSKTAIRTLAWSQDGRFLAVGADDGSMTIWYPAQNQQKPIVMTKGNNIVHSLTWSPQGDQLASASGNVVTLWKLM